MRIALAALAALLLGAAALVAASFRSPAALDPPREPWDAYLIRNVNLVSMVEGEPEIAPGRTVLVAGGRIEAVGADLTLEPGRAEALRIWEGGGMYLLPGLIDAHVHLWDEAELAAYLSHGVTSVRNMSGMPWHLALIRRLEAGRLIGPSVMTTGPILNSPGPNQQDNHALVETAEAARAAVRAQHVAGYDTLKVYSNLTREAYEAALAEAHALGMSVSGHTPEGLRGPGVPQDAPFEIAFAEALADGFVTIEHVESIVWHGLRDRLDGEGMDALAAEIAASGVAVTPTLIAHDNLVRVAESGGVYLHRSGTDTLNPVIVGFEQDVYAYWSRQDPAAREGPRRAFYRQATGQLHAAGVPLLAGSDAGIFTNLPGSALIRELELLVASGLGPHEALRAATATPADVLGWTDRGRIAPGMRADLVLVRDNPLEDVSRLERPEAVMVGGVWLTRTDLDALEAASVTQQSRLRTWRRLAELLLSLP